MAVAARRLELSFRQAKAGRRCQGWDASAISSRSRKARAASPRRRRKRWPAVRRRPCLPPALADPARSGRGAHEIALVSGNRHRVGRAAGLSQGWLRRVLHSSAAGHLLRVRESTIQMNQQGHAIEQLSGILFAPSARSRFRIPRRSGGHPGPFGIALSPEGNAAS